ncbi:MAG: hypothetical protein ACJAWW_000500 [Sulfurimonas sp.]|jgi:hypothetical protein
MIKFIILSILTIVVFSGCSVKKFNEGVDSITNDISTKLEEGRDKSQD